MSRSRFFSFFFSTFMLLAFSGSAFADWFLSSETKALIVKADAGDVKAQFLVGAAYDTGEGAPRNGENAIKYYRMAAEQGHVEAQNSLGSVLQAEKRYTEALPWYERAAAQGHALATNNLAYLHDMGLGVPQDRQKGFELYSRAAELGWAEAMWNMANMYGAGQLGKVDLAMACIWTYRAGKFAKPSERRLIAYTRQVLLQLERTMTVDQFSVCRQEGDAWSPQATQASNTQAEGQTEAAR